ncbi:Hypothetical protein FKW44_004581 [Caligus rogercresseyi]|uniref:Uncharacterized protein n=1 Tax=Caligus rogercresseyi TaxID=217165 RepID=A0A7T8HMB8_CALRO|nr:Hypothetical protein FKW44_004581 [Caligus rogercresseyi]
MESSGTWIVKRGSSSLFLLIRLLIPTLPPSPSSGSVSDDYGDSTHEPSFYTFLGLVNLEEKVSPALLFLNKHMKESSSASESHL